MGRSIANLTIVAGLAMMLAGCNHCNRQQNPAPGAPQGGPYLGAPTPAPQGGQWLPDAPAPAPIGPGGPAGPQPSQSRSFDSQSYSGDFNWKPGSADSTGPSIRLYPPEVDENPDGAKKLEPKSAEPPLADPKPRPKVEESENPKQPLAGKPVGIPQFAEAQGGVASGLRPSLDDGLDWLKANGYKTVLYIHEPGEPESTDRRQVEKRGLKFVGLAVSSATLTRQTVDEFMRIVGDTGEGPLFVYDNDGALTGSLWYLHFRLSQQCSDASARNQAHRVGLEENRGGAHTEMWNAVRRLADGIEP
jgi:protein tyrosine phosphatase (PTP) superfamily phosphohydrolase (DUF442 family)